MSDVRFTIRKAHGRDIEPVIALVRDVVMEKFGHLLRPPPEDFGDETTWLHSLVAEIDGDMAGVGRADGNDVSDLWLRPHFRGRRIGSYLLASLEKQIAQAGHATARLRVVGENHRAARFYIKHGWQIAGRAPHEIWGFEMIDMTKNLAAVTSFRG